MRMRSRHDDGVSEIVGTILLTALAVIFASGFVVLLFTIPPPASAAQATINAYVLPNAPNQLILEHRGGPTLPLTQLTATVTVNGTATQYNIGNSIGLGWTVLAADGTSKAASDRFAPGDRAIFTANALYGAQASALVTDTGVNALVLSPTALQPTQDTTHPTLTSARTTSTTTVLANFSEPLSTISPSDLLVAGSPPTAAVLVGNGTSAELTVAAFSPSATPSVATVASPAGTRDLSGLALTGGTTVTAADGVAPGITAGPSSGTPGNASATITWTTDEASTSVVEFGPTTAYGRTVSDTNLVTPHSSPLTSLTAGTLYYYRVESADALGNLATSSQGTFSTEQITGGGGGSFDPTAPHSWTAVQTFGAGDLKISDITTGAGTLVLPTAPDILAGLNSNQLWTATQTFGQGATLSSGQALLLTPTATGSLPSDSAGNVVYDSTLGALRVGTGAGYGTVLTNGNVSGADITSGTIPDGRLAANVSRIDQAKTWTAVQTFGVNATLDASDVTTGTLALANGGTGASTAATARSNLGAAASGANGDITSLTGLTTALAVNEGGTGATTAGTALSNLGGVPTTRLVSTDATLTGGGSLAADRTLGIDLSHANSWTALQTFGTPGAALTPTATGLLPATAQGKIVYDSSVDALKVGNATAYAQIAALGKAQTWTALQTFGSQASFDASALTSGTLGVARGGTGATTFTAHGVLIGEGAGAIVATGTGSAGQALLSNGAADPTFGTLGVGFGGTGAGSAATARTNLGVVNTIQGSSGNTAMAANQFIGLGGASGTQAANQVVVPVTGHITAVYCYTQGTPTGSLAITVDLNQAAQSLTCTIPNGAHAGSGTGASIAVSVGDTVDLSLPSNIKSDSGTVSWTIIIGS